MRMTDNAIDHAMHRMKLYVDTLPDTCDLDKEPQHLAAVQTVLAIESEWFLDPKVRKNASLLTFHDDEDDDGPEPREMIKT